MAKQYKVLAGTHAEGKEIFGVGDIVTSEIELDEVFGSQKFQLITASVSIKSEPEPVVEETPEPVDEEKSEPENVAASFRGLKKYVEEGLVVLETEDGFWIYVDGAVVNDEPLKRNKVKAAVVDYFG